MTLPPQSVSAPALPSSSAAESLLSEAPIATLVVGAGLAGLVVAYRLRQAGQAVTVVEARDRAGGRVLTVPQALGTAIAAELGGEAFDSGHIASLTLAQELGLPMTDLWATAPPSDGGLCWFDGQSWDRTALMAEFTAGMQAHAADWEAVQQFMADGVRTAVIAALDALSIPAYLDHMGLSAPLQRWVSVAYTIKYGMEAAEQSSLNLLSFFRSSADCEELFGGSDERFYLRGGNGQLPSALAAQVADALVLNTALTALETAPEGGYWATLQAPLEPPLEQGTTIHRVKCDRVVLTIPFSVLRSIPLDLDLPPQQRRAIAELGYNTPTKVITAYDAKPWQHRASQGVAYTDLPLRHCWEASDSLLTPGGGLFVAYLGGKTGQAASDNSLEGATAAVLQDLGEIFPELMGHHLPVGSLRSPWLTDPYSQGAYSCYRVGQWTAFYGWEGQRAGNVWFAGEHCSRRYQGYMEGACETGEQVALEILMDLSR